MEIGPKEFGDKISVMISYFQGLGCGARTYKSSSGEMNTSLRLIIYTCRQFMCEQILRGASETYILVLYMLEEL
jgi:hypothetical protein